MQLPTNFTHMDIQEFEISIKAFNQFYFIPYLNKWMSIFIHGCIECQQNKHINQKIQTASIQTFSENTSYFTILPIEYQWTQKDL